MARDSSLRGAASRPRNDGAADFLLEIGCEEIPADYLPGALDLDEQAEGLLRSAKVALETKSGNVKWREMHTFGTPRRLVLHVKGVPPRTQVWEKGPPVQIAYDSGGKPTRAAEAFARKHHLNALQLVRGVGPKGEEVLFADYEVPTTNVLAEAIPQIIQGIRFPKTMRWDSSGVRFARPIRWLLALYGTTPVVSSFGLLKSAAWTHGTRREGDKLVPIRSVAAYLPTLERLKVVLEEGWGFRSGIDNLGHNIEPKRKKSQSLLSRLEAAARTCGGKLPDQASEEFQWLLSTATFLAEDPKAQAGSFRTEYLDLPTEVLAAAMAKHLRIFSVSSPDGKKLLPKFLAVLEGKPTQPKQVLSNYERILEARFTDARFFWKEDTRAPLESKVPQLSKVVFHERLGTMEERVPRLERLMNMIADRIQDPREVRNGIGRAARLAKADLVTQMVREFPSLQGVIGAQYARHSGEPEEAARAIAEQYRPRAASDPVPSTPLGALLSLADRIDTLVGYFGVGLKPTGSMDPYALRRQALGVVRILLEPPSGVSFVGLSIDTLFEQGIQSWGSRIAADPAKLKDELALFLRERFETLSSVVGKIDRPLIAAVLDADGADFAGAGERLNLLRDWWRAKGPKRQMLERAAKVAERTGRIVKSAKGMELPAQVDPAALREPVEKELWETWNRIAPQMQSHLEQRQYERATEAYSALYPVVHRFFEKVFVMDEEMNLRRNRLTLLREIFQGLAGRFADLSQLPLTGVDPS